MHGGIEDTKDRLVLAVLGEPCRTDHLARSVACALSDHAHRGGDGSIQVAEVVGAGQDRHNLSFPE